ncbi:MAG: NAD-dependent epimerase/dehydratase family protein [Saccharofermentanales bacterium]
MRRQCVFLTGATGSMGLAGLNELLKDASEQDVVILARPSTKNKVLLLPYSARSGLTIHWGDLCSYEDVYACVARSDIVLHVGAFVSPEADYYPERAMQINYGSTMNIITAIREQKRENEVKLVYIGTIAETGDRMPPIHWGRVGDPLKPSVYDYYAVSKVAAERAVIESGLRYWVSLRQTGIISPKMTEIHDAIIFHNCLDNVLEYVSDRDSGILLRNVCHELPDDFWCHIYNIGGGESCRVSCHTMFTELFGRIGITDLSHAVDSRWFATRNFHGHYYLDADRLEEYLHFRHDSLDYYYDAYLKQLGLPAKISRMICRLPGGQKIIGSVLKRRFLKTAKTSHGTVNFLRNNHEGHIAAYFISRGEWKKILPVNELEQFADWNTVVPIDHGYDEHQPQSELAIDDVQAAARFRGGILLSVKMQKGDWATKLNWKCAFGHEFDASPRVVLEGGHWCPVCERESWNYHEIARVNPFFAQVWYPLHSREEQPREYKKIVSELDVKFGRQ